MSSPNHDPFSIKDSCTTCPNGWYSRSAVETDALKRVVDYNVKVRPLPDNSNVDLNNAKMSVNPFCEIALEEAVRIKEAGNADEVIAVTVGKTESQEQLRTALALGADRAILVESDFLLEPLAISKVLSKLVEQEKPDLIILGKQAIDGDNNQTGQMLAAMLNYSQATNASEVNLEENNVSVTREIDGGLQTLKLSKPAIVTTDLRLNEPRYASLPNIMKAKKKELNIITIADLGVDVNPRTELLSVELPPSRDAGIIVESVDELVDKLKNEAKVIT
jgi:electron transfer flavoprotein beta subunit